MDKLSHIWITMQRELFPVLEEELGPMTDKEKRFLEILSLLDIERFIVVNRTVGRPESDRSSLLRAFILKAYYNLTTTRHLIEMLKGNANLRRICGWDSLGYFPTESTFSRAFDSFSEAGLLEIIHNGLIRKYHSDKIVGHISRDASAVEAREKPVKKKKPVKVPAKKGRPKKGETREKPLKTIEKQITQNLDEMIAGLPKDCDVGGKKDSHGNTHYWIGYKGHIDTADAGIPISFVLSSASVHDSQAAIPLMRKTNERVTLFYELMDSAYDDEIIKSEIIRNGHVPIIDENPRRKIETVVGHISFKTAEEKRYAERSTAERANSRLKDEFGWRHLRVKGYKKVYSHLMFGIIVLAADQLLRLIT